MKIRNDRLCLTVFLLIMSTTVTALYDLVIPIYIPRKDLLLSPFLAVFTFILVCFSTRSKGGVYDKLLFRLVALISLPVLIAFLIEPIRFIHTPGRNPLFIFVSLLNIVCFIGFYLFSICRFEGFYERSIRLYWKLNYIIALSAAIVLVLFLIGVTDNSAWGLPNSFGDNFRAKYELVGAVENVYSVVFNIVVIIPNYIKPIGAIGEFGSFSGISYEPHIATYFMTPAFLLTFKYKKFTVRNFFVYFFPFMFFFLLASSLTNIIGLMVIFSIYLVSGISSNKLFFYFLFLLAITVLIVSNTQAVLDAIKFADLFLENKMSGRSGEESSGFISYILSPKSLVGYGAFNIPTAHSDGISDIGLIGAILITWFYLNILFLSGYLYLKGHLVHSLIGIYIFLHTMKFPMHAIQLPYLYFTIFVMLSPLVKRFTFSSKPPISDNKCDIHGKV
ncbi:hypothetical protein AB6D63_22125 [Vibrio splendidus]